MRASRVIAVCLTLLSCSSETHLLGIGRSGDASAAAPDAAAPDTTPDAAGVGVLGAPAVVAFADQGEPSDDDPSLTQDLREMYFNSKREGGQGKEDIWYTTRATSSDAWLAPQPASELNSEQRETGIALSADGLTIWFSSDRPNGSGGLDVYTAVRSARGEPFRDVRRVAELCTKGDDLVSAVDLTATTLYLARRDDEDDDYDLYVARRSSLAQSFGEATPIGSLNSEREESDAYAVRDGAYLVFTRGGDLLLAERVGMPDGYVVTTALDALNSDQDERDAWATEDLRYIVFSSKRSGSYLLYEARVRN